MDKEDADQNKYAVSGQSGHDTLLPVSRMNSRIAQLQGGDFGRVIDVPPRGEGDGEPERSEKHLPRPGDANCRRRPHGNRMKIVKFLQISGGRRLIFPGFILQFFTQEAATLARVSRDILLFAEVSCNV
jgi:hypothetical protein